MRHIWRDSLIELRDETASPVHHFLAHAQGIPRIERVDREVLQRHAEVVGESFDGTLLHEVVGHAQIELQTVRVEEKVVLVHGLVRKHFVRAKHHVGEDGGRTHVRSAAQLRDLIVPIDHQLHFEIVRRQFRNHEGHHAFVLAALEPDPKNLLPVIHAREAVAQHDMVVVQFPVREEQLVQTEVVRALLPPLLQRAQRVRVLD